MHAGGGASSAPRTAIWSGNAGIKGGSEAAKMALLTISLVGIQFTWGVEMTYCTPYLLRLGLTKDKVSLVWLAGPLSGLIMQPIVGILADRSTSPYGRRRPFMLLGSLIVCVCLFVLGWTAEVVSFFIGGKGTGGATIALAVLSIYGIDFAINAVQAGARSLVSDTLPAGKQQTGSAWASRMVAVGSLIGYGFGAVDLTQIFGGFLGDTQFKQLIVVACVTLLGSVGLTCWAVEERVLVSSGRASDGDSDEGGGILDLFRQIIFTALNLPERIAAICWVQFWCWIGWFPFLFYSTTWLGEVYLRFNAPADARDHPDSLGQMGRIGSTALIVFSIVTFASSVVLPWFVESPAEESGGFTPRPPESIAWLVTEIQKFKPTLVEAWSYSHIIFAGSMFAAPFVTSLRAATTIVALCGIPWALACWAPFTAIGVEISRLSQPGLSQQGGSRSISRVVAADSGAEKEKQDEESGSGDLSGVYLGILNVYTTLPQFIGTFISWVVFSVLEPGKSPELAKEAHPDEHHSTDGPNAIAVCLFIGALAAVIAGYKTETYRRMIERSDA